MSDKDVALSAELFRRLHPEIPLKTHFEGQREYDTKVLRRLNKHIGTVGDEMEKLKDRMQNLKTTAKKEFADLPPEDEKKVAFKTIHSLLNKLYGEKTPHGTTAWPYAQFVKEVGSVFELYDSNTGGYGECKALRVVADGISSNENTIMDHQDAIWNTVKILLGLIVGVEIRNIIDPTDESSIEGLKENLVAEKTQNLILQKEIKELKANVKAEKEKYENLKISYLTLRNKTSDMVKNVVQTSQTYADFGSIVNDLIRASGFENPDEIYNPDEEDELRRLLDENTQFSNLSEAGRKQLEELENQPMEVIPTTFDKFKTWDMDYINSLEKMSSGFQAHIRYVSKSRLNLAQNSSTTIRTAKNELQRLEKSVYPHTTPTGFLDRFQQSLRIVTDQTDAKSMNEDLFILSLEEEPKKLEDQVKNISTIFGLLTAVGNQLDRGITKLSEMIEIQKSKLNFIIKRHTSTDTVGRGIFENLNNLQKFFYRIDKKTYDSFKNDVNEGNTLQECVINVQKMIENTETGTQSIDKKATDVRDSFIDPFERFMEFMLASDDNSLFNSVEKLKKVMNPKTMEVDRSSFDSEGVSYSESVKKMRQRISTYKSDVDLMFTFIEERTEERESLENILNSRYSGISNLKSVEKKMNELFSVNITDSVEQLIDALQASIDDNFKKTNQKARNVLNFYEQFIGVLSEKFKRIASQKRSINVKKYEPNRDEIKDLKIVLSDSVILKSLETSIDSSIEQMDIFELIEFYEQLTETYRKGFESFSQLFIDLTNEIHGYTMVVDDTVLNFKNTYLKRDVGATERTPFYSSLRNFTDKVPGNAYYAQVYKGTYSNLHSFIRKSGSTSLKKVFEDTFTKINTLVRAMDQIIETCHSTLHASKTAKAITEDEVGLVNQLREVQKQNDNYNAVVTGINSALSHLFKDSRTTYSLTYVSSMKGTDANEYGILVGTGFAIRQLSIFLENIQVFFEALTDLAQKPVEEGTFNRVKSQLSEQVGYYVALANDMQNYLNSSKSGEEKISLLRDSIDGQLVSNRNGMMIQLLSP
jgi:hypothetical protein